MKTRAIPLGQREALRKLIREQGVVGLRPRLRDEALRPSTEIARPLAALGECPDFTCGTHRLSQPQVRPQFATYAAKEIGKWCDEHPHQDEQLTILSLGSGFLLFELELLEELARRRRVAPRVVHLVDPIYGPEAPVGEQGLNDCCGSQKTHAERHALARSALAAFAGWFPDTRVVAHGSIADFEMACDEDPSIELHVCMLLDCQLLDHEVDIMPLLRRRLSFGGRFLRLTNLRFHRSPFRQTKLTCDGALAGKDDDGEVEAERAGFWSNLLDGGATGDCLQRPEQGGADLVPSETLWMCPPLPPPRYQMLRSRMDIAPIVRAMQRGLRIFRVTAEGVKRRVVVIRSEPSRDARLIGYRSVGELAIVKQDDSLHPWVELDPEDDWLGQQIEAAKLWGHGERVTAWMLTDGSMLGFGALLREVDLEELRKRAAGQAEGGFSAANAERA